MDIARNTLVLPYNDIEQLRQAFAESGEKIAAVIVEPIAANMGVVKPRDEFHAELRRLTQDRGSLLIHDEVVTGFRVSYSGYQGVTDVRPDLLTFGKVIGGGLPIGAVVGRRDVMEHLAPVGPVFHAELLRVIPLLSRPVYQLCDPSTTLSMKAYIPAPERWLMPLTTRSPAPA